MSSKALRRKALQDRGPARARCFPLPRHWAERNVSRAEVSSGKFHQESRCEAGKEESPLRSRADLTRDTPRATASTVRAIFSLGDHVSMWRRAASPR